MKHPTLDDYLSGEFASQTALPPVDPCDYDLYNPAGPSYNVKRQRPEHLLMVMLKAQGMSYREIAQRTGFCDTAVQAILKQPWARQQVVFEMKKAGRDSIESILAGEVVDSILTLVEIRDNKESRAGDRRSAAEYLINRRLGVPKQSIEHSGSVKLEDLSDEELVKRLPQAEREQHVDLVAKAEAALPTTNDCKHN